MEKKLSRANVFFRANGEIDSVEFISNKGQWVDIEDYGDPSKMRNFMLGLEAMLNIILEAKENEKP